jgi:antagonist of KipI
MSGFKVEKQGLLTTVQDKGRPGYQQYGIIVGGAMDPWALRLANVLVGNPDGAAGLEITMMGPELVMTADTMIAVGGGDLSASIDGKDIPLWTAVPVSAGQTISFGKPRSGVRAYIAFGGGIDVPEVLGSRSTYIKAELGGYQGRELNKGDHVSLLPKTSDVPRRRLHPSLIPDYDKTRPVRVISGPDEDLFNEDTMRRFYESEFYLTNEVDRMGYRLEGPGLAPEKEAGILSDATTMGTIQVPAGGQPMLLLADRQTAGGYARIGTVIQEDMPRVAQYGPHEKIQFSAVKMEEAQQLIIKREQAFRCLMKLLRL